MLVDHLLKVKKEYKNSKKQLLMKYYMIQDLNQELAKELHKPIIRKFRKRKLHSSFIDNIRSADLVDMELINKFDKGIIFLLCVIGIFSKYTWVIPLKDKNVTITNSFSKNLRWIEWQTKQNMVR